MGRFLNPDNSAFQTTLNSEIYVDKTGLIAYTNRVVDTMQAFICNSRPRRFGKSITAQYNDENSLSSVLTIAYLSSMQYYFKSIRELPTGRGFADFVFVPKPDYLADYPALVVELKWNKSANTALNQIKEKQYSQSLLQYTGNILLVGINYNRNNKTHECFIEEYQK